MTYREQKRTFPSDEGRADDELQPGNNRSYAVGAGLVVSDIAEKKYQKDGALILGKTVLEKNVENRKSDVSKQKKKIRLSGRGAVAAVKRGGWKIAAGIMSVALAVGLVPMFTTSSSDMNTSQAAEPGKVISFANMSHDQVSEAMATMTVDEIVDAMTLHEKICQMFCVWPENIPSSATESKASTQTAISQDTINGLKQYPWGGACFFGPNLTQASGSTVAARAASVKKYTDDLQKNNKYPMVLTIDEEGGTVARIGGTLGYGYNLQNMINYAGQGTQVAYDNGVKLATNCSDLGFNWDFAPVADSGPSTIFLQYRKYSYDYATAGNLVASAVRGFHSKNVATALKHFPGHGNGSGDSHAGSVVVHRTHDQLLAEDWVPFIKGIEAGTDAVMIGHLIIPEYGDESATVTREIVTGVLRDELGFDGVIVTDAMDMAGLVNAYGGTKAGKIQASIDAIKAGNDLILMTEFPKQSVEKVKELVGTGEISEDQIDASVARLMTLKRNRGIIPDISDAIYTASDGTTFYGSLADMWSKAATSGGTVKLLRDIKADANGSFGTGTGIDGNGTLVLAGKSVTLDLNGHTLDKNLSSSSAQADRHIFKISAAGTLTIKDTSEDDTGKITGGNATVGSVAYVAGSGTKFIIDGGSLTGNKSSGNASSSIVYGETGSIMRFGVNTGADSDKVSITDNVAPIAVYVQGDLYIMAPLTVKNNGGSNIYLGSSAAKPMIQHQGLTGGSRSVGISASPDYRSGSDLAVHSVANAATTMDTNLDALFSDDQNYELIAGANGTSIIFKTLEGEAKYTSPTGAITYGDFATQMAAAAASGGTVTILKDVEASGVQFDIVKSVELQLNGKHLTARNAGKCLFGVKSGANFVVNDTTSPAVSEQEITGTSAGEASLNGNVLTYYEDRIAGSELKTYKVTADFSNAGTVRYTTSDDDPDGVISIPRDASAATSITVEGGLVTGVKCRAGHVGGAGSFTLDGGYLSGCTSKLWASTLFGVQTSTINVKSGVIAANTTNDGSNNVGSIASINNNGTVNITGGVITGNKAVKAGAISNTSKMYVSNATICHNTTNGTGGGIWVSSAKEAAVTNVLLSNNTASAGGGIYVSSGMSLTVTGSNIAENHANTDGGGIYTGGTVSLSSTRVFDNTANTSAGGIWNGSDGLSLSGAVCVRGNTAGSYQSDIDLVTAGNTVKIAGSLSGASPSSVGVMLPGAKEGDQIARAMSGITIDGESASAFFVDNTTYTGGLKNNGVYIRSAESRFIDDSGNVTYDDFSVLWSTMMDNTSNKGTLQLLDDVSYAVTSSALFSRSEKILDLNGHTLSLTSNKPSTNTQDTSSPIRVDGGTLAIDDASFDESAASNKTKLATFTSGHLASFDRAGKNLTYYTTEHGRSGIATYENTVDLSSCGAIEYTHDSGADDGIIEVSAAATLNINGGRLSATNARALLAYPNSGTAVVNINGGYIVDNHGGLGSTILTKGGSVVNIHGGVIAANNGNGKGTMWASGTNSNIFNMDGGIISGNYALSGGGAFYIESSNNALTITGGMITNNVTGGNGGGICYTNNALANGLNISQATISGNKAVNGGGIWTDKKLNDPDCHIDANIATSNGGGIYASGDVILDAVCVQDNTAGLLGGGIYAAGNTSVEISSSTGSPVYIAGNTASGTASNLYVANRIQTSELSTASLVKVTSPLTADSKIGLTWNNCDFDYAKVVSGNLVGGFSTPNVYSIIFTADNGTDQIVQRNSDKNNLYVIKGGEEGPIEPYEGMISTGKTVTIKSKNPSTNAASNVPIIGPGNGSKTIADFAGASTNAFWDYFIISPEVIGGVTYYKCTKYIPGNQTITASAVQKTTILQPGEFAIATHGGNKELFNSSNGAWSDGGDHNGEHDKFFPLKVGSYAKFDFDPVSVSNLDYSSTSRIGNLVVYQRQVTTPPDVDYTIRFAYHHPFVGIGEGEEEHWTLATDIPGTDSEGKITRNGKVGELVVAGSPDELASYGKFIPDDKNYKENSLALSDGSVFSPCYWSKTLSADPTQNMLWVILEYPNAKYSYDIEKYDAKTGELIEGTAIRGLTSNTLPIEATENQKTLEGYDYVYKEGLTVDTISNVSENEVPVLKLYFSKHEHYTLKLYLKGSTESFNTFSLPGASIGSTFIIPDEYFGTIEIDGKAYRYVEANNTIKPGQAITMTSANMNVSLYYQPQSIIEIYKWYWTGSDWQLIPGGNYPVKKYGFENESYSLSPAEINTAGYILVPAFESTPGLAAEFGSPDNDPVQINAYYNHITGDGTTAAEKPAKNNGLKPIETYSTANFITMNLYDYSRKTNEKYDADNEYPQFVWPKNSDGSYTGASDLTGEGLGEIVFADNGDTIDRRNAGNVTNTNQSSLINRTMTTSGFNYYGNFINTPTRSRTTPSSLNADAIKKNLSSSGAPVVSKNGKDLSYLFPGANGDETYCTIMNAKYKTDDGEIKAKNIDKLFTYDEESGTYSYSSQQNHAEYNVDTGNFEVYDALITSNVLGYAYGNFLPFQNINTQTTKVTDINNDYLNRISSYAKYKKSLNDSRYKAYVALLEAIENARSGLSSNWNYMDYIAKYWSSNNAVPDYVKDLAAGTNKKAPGKTYDDVYMIDYDEVKDFHFGMDFGMNFIISENGKVGANRDDMIFEFEGDDDVWIFIDNVMFLNLTGIHRQVGGKINFATGEVFYGDLNYNQKSPNDKTPTGYIGYPAETATNTNTTDYKYTFEQILTAAYTEQGLTTTQIKAKLSDMLNEEGTFRDWSRHSFKMFYLERGSGSGILSFNFNLPVIPDNTLLVGKDVTNTNNDEFLPLISNPDFKFQVVKYDENKGANGDTVTDDKGYPVSYLPEGQEYLIYENGINTGKTGQVDKNGIITLKNNQFAAIVGDKNSSTSYKGKQPGDTYVVQELLQKEYCSQYDQITATNNVAFIDGDALSIPYEYDPEKVTPGESLTYDGKDYLVRRALPIKISSNKNTGIQPDDLTSTLFDNRLDTAELGSIAISKELLNDTCWNGDENKEFTFAVAFDGYPIQKGVKYYIYSQGDLDEHGNYTIDESNMIARKEVEQTGIIKIKAGEVAVLRFMLAGSKYSVCEVSDDEDNLYHPIYETKTMTYELNDNGTYKRNEDGNPIFTGYITTKNVQEGYVQPGTAALDLSDLPISIVVKNQRAENLIVSKILENNETSENFNFNLDITYVDDEINDTYFYDLVPMGSIANLSEQSELSELEDVIEKYETNALNNDPTWIYDFIPERKTVTFVNGRVSLEIPANYTLIIYGLPYQGEYTITEEADTQNRYTVSYKTENDEDFISAIESKDGAQTRPLVLDSKSAGTSDSTNSIAIKNTRVGSIAIDKIVTCPIDFGDKFTNNYEKLFEFTISNATSYDGTPITGTFPVRTISENAEENSNEETGYIEFDENGNTVFEISHGQTMVIENIPVGTTYTVTETNDYAFITENKVKIGEEEETILDSLIMAASGQADQGRTTDTITVDVDIINEETGDVELYGNRISYVNTLITSYLPTTGGIGLTVVALAMIGTGIIIFHFVRRQREKTLPDTPENGSMS